MRRELSRAIAAASASEVLALVRRLLERDESAVRLIGYELCASHPAAMQRLRAPVLRGLGVHLTSWFDVDCFGKFLAGPAWQVGHIKDSEILAWARSKNYWWRRASLVSTIGIDSRRALRVCYVLREDREPMVWKALSWALRELTKRDPDAVRRFIAAHDGVLARGVVREVRSKLETGTKGGRARRARLRSDQPGDNFRA